MQHAPETISHGPGHNSADKSISAQALKSFVERLERLESDRQNVGTDIREVYAELKSAGFTPKIVRKLIKLRAMDASDRDEETALLDMYTNAVGL